jgi:AcrR family transcriptional regulator
MTTRDRILDGAVKVMREHGLAKTTTKQIASAAGYSEATLYKIFDDKVELFLAVLTERLPAFTPVREGPTSRVGRGTVQRNLEAFTTEALLFYIEVFPIGASLFSDPVLLTRHREGIAAHGAGPQQVSEALAAYLRAEQRAGRIRREAEPKAAAMTMIGAAYHQAFLLTFAGRTCSPATARRFAAGVVRTVTPVLLAEPA